MIQRCTNPRHKLWHAYGGRGVTICQRWMRFENFFQDMGERPTANHSLDRFPDYNGNYEPGNCRWATYRQQQNNKTDNHYVTFDGRTMSVQDWADTLKVKANTLVYRLKRGWSIERAMTEPIHEKPARVGA